MLIFQKQEEIVDVSRGGYKLVVLKSEIEGIRLEEEFHIITINGVLMMLKRLSEKCSDCHESTYIVLTSDSRLRDKMLLCKCTKEDLFICIV